MNSRRDAASTGIRQNFRARERPGCLNKAIGAPVGSFLAGSQAMIDEVVRWRDAPRERMAADRLHRRRGPRRPQRMARAARDGHEDDAGACERRRRPVRARQHPSGADQPHVPKPAARRRARFRRGAVLQWCWRYNGHAKHRLAIHRGVRERLRISVQYAAGPIGRHRDQSGRFGLTYRGSSLETVVHSTAEQRQIFKGANHAFPWTQSASQQAFGRLLDAYACCDTEGQVLADVRRIDALEITGLGPPMAKSSISSI